MSRVHALLCLLALPWLVSCSGLSQPLDATEVRKLGGCRLTANAHPR